MLPKYLHVLLTLTLTAAASGAEPPAHCRKTLSTNGNFGSQASRDRAHDFVAWQTAESDYLFQIAAHRCSGCHETAPEDPDCIRAVARRSR